MISYKQGSDCLSLEDLRSLYDDAGWSAYTKDMAKLYRGIKNSSQVISAWSNKSLVGLIRAISDKETIVYIQDILVLNEFKKKKIGTTLINKILENSKDIRQIVLLTNSQDNTSCSFYKSLGFKPCNSNEELAFIKK